MAIVRYYKDLKTGSLIGIDEEGKGHIQKLFNIPTDEIIGGNTSLPDNIITDETGLYQVKNGKVYPISHPDISTQPSILPQRFGKFDIKEVLVKQYIGEPQYSWGHYCEIVDLTTPIYVNELTDFTSYPREATSCSTYIYNSEYIVFGDGELDAPPTILSNPLIGNNWFYVSNSSYSWHDFRYKIIYPMYDKTLGFPYFKYFLAKYELDVNATVYAANGDRYVECTLEEALNGNATNPLTQILDPEIPSSATIISASSFNADACVPAICKKENGKWTITNNEDVEPDFTLVRYYEEENGSYYYYAPQEEQRIIIATYQGSDGLIRGLNAQSDWGNSDIMLDEGTIIGKISNGQDSWDLILSSLSTDIIAKAGPGTIYIARDIHHVSTYRDFGDYDITVELYAL